jgi:L-alanine-DL-glutamate epimerase-like enolase superfamily enzyme
MPRIVAFAVHAIELPFRVKFEHAAAARRSSESLFVELELDDRTTGWGEALPRRYVTGETRDAACGLLAEAILPRLLGRSFGSFEELLSFLTACNGRAPDEWVPHGQPQSAAWCAVDLALLDAFGRSFGRRPFGAADAGPAIRYSGVLPAGGGWKRDAQLLAYRLLGFRALKLKIDRTTTLADIARIRRLAGPGMDLRADVNMGWTLGQALERMPGFAKYGIHSFEQPLAADDPGGAAHLIRETGLDVMADESLNTPESLQLLIGRRACTAINARISKCGGLVATLARCREAREAGLWVQLGCQVGESSLLSAAHLHLCAAFPEVRHAEGCFGSLLLAEDPASPRLRIGHSGRPPALPAAPGLGVRIDRECLARCRVGHWQGGR